MTKKFFDEVPYAAPRRKPQSHRLTEKQRLAAPKREASRVAYLRAQDGGKEGARITKVKIRISGTRSEARTMRCRPGTFEWRYGRKKQDALFHAGSHFAQLWERAGIAVASSANFLRGTSSGYVTGISDARVNAMDRLYGAAADLGRFSVERLIDYCVAGMTTAEIARKGGMSEREASGALHQDLRQCAMHFNFV